VRLVGCFVDGGGGGASGQYAAVSNEP